MRKLRYQIDRFKLFILNTWSNEKMMSHILLSKKELKDKNQKSKNKDNQEYDNKITDTFAFERKDVKHEINNIGEHELTDELSNQELENRFLLFKCKIDLDGNFVETILPLKHFEAFEKNLEAIDDHYFEGSTSVQQANIFIETYRKLFNEVKRSDYGTGICNIDKVPVRYQGSNCYSPEERVIVFSCLLFLRLRDKDHNHKIPHKEYYITILTEGKSSEKLTCCKIYIFCKNYNLPYGFLDGKKTPISDNTNARQTPDTEKGLHFLFIIIVL